MCEDTTLLVVLFLLFVIYYFGAVIKALFWLHGFKSREENVEKFEV